MPIRAMRLNRCRLICLPAMVCWAGLLLFAGGAEAYDWKIKSYSIEVGTLEFDRANVIFRSGDKTEVYDFSVQAFLSAGAKAPAVPGLQEIGFRGNDGREYNYVQRPKGAVIAEFLDTPGNEIESVLYLCEKEDMEISRRGKTPVIRVSIELEDFPGEVTLWKNTSIAREELVTLVPTEADASIVAAKKKLGSVEVAEFIAKDESLEDVLNKLNGLLREKAKELRGIAVFHSDALSGGEMDAGKIRVSVDLRGVSLLDVFNEVAARSNLQVVINLPAIEFRPASAEGELIVKEYKVPENFLMEPAGEERDRRISTTELEVRVPDPGMAQFDPTRNIITLRADEKAHARFAKKIAALWENRK